MNRDYYNGTKLLSLKDINGDTPEIYMCVGNRTAGKTTFFSRLLVNRVIKKESKFCLLYRFKYELNDCANKFFNDIGQLFFNGYTMSSKSKNNGVYHELYLNNELCGFATALTSSEQIKKTSHIFNDVNAIFFDEFISESNRYAPDEISRFYSIHSSMARGHNKQVRYLPVYMCANNFSILNPYYTVMGVSKRIQKDTKFLKGDGFVLEQSVNESSKNAQMKSGFNRAFKDTAYYNFAVYANPTDNENFIEKPSGKSRYIVTLKYNSSLYAVREYYSDGVIYVSDNVDTSFPIRLAVTTNDHQLNYTLLSQNALLIKSIRSYFECGLVRFKDLESKECLLSAISYF